MIIELIIF